MAILCSLWAGMLDINDRTDEKNGNDRNAFLNSCRRIQNKN